MTIRPFTIHVPDDVLIDVRRRLDATRWPASLDEGSWEDGASLAVIRLLVDHWRHRFDWRAQEARLNHLPQVRARIEGLEVHAVHRRGTGPSPLPLLLTHGWPGSFAEFEHLVPLLADPGAHGGDPADAFHVVVPSLPGYGFSPAPQFPGVGSSEIAGFWRGLMAQLGYERFGAQGGDIGAGVSIWLARRFPDDVVGAHVNYVSQHRDGWHGRHRHYRGHCQQRQLDSSTCAPREIRGAPACFRNVPRRDQHEPAQASRGDKPARMQVFCIT